MSILKLKPCGKDYLWGGRRLVEEYGKEACGEVLAETWELSCHPDGPSVIENGVHAGKTVQQYIEEQGKAVLGTHCRRFRDFPILVKFIDAKDNLSIQVHPDNRYALSHEGLILSILVDTFFTRISMSKQHPEIHSISVV